MNTRCKIDGRTMVIDGPASLGQMLQIAGKADAKGVIVNGRKISPADFDRHQFPADCHVVTNMQAIEKARHG